MTAACSNSNRPAPAAASMQHCSDVQHHSNIYASSSWPSAGISAPLVDGVTLQCAAPLANHAKPLWLRAAPSVETLSGMKSHCKAVPAWASVALSVSSARSGTPAGPVTHSAAPEGGSIGTSYGERAAARGRNMKYRKLRAGGNARTRMICEITCRRRYRQRAYGTRRRSADPAWWAPARARVSCRRGARERRGSPLCAV